MERSAIDVLYLVVRITKRMLPAKVWFTIWPTIMALNNNPPLYLSFPPASSSYNLYPLLCTIPNCHCPYFRLLHKRLHYP